MLKLEKDTNPFLRCDSDEIIQTVSHHANKKLNNEVDIFHEMREWKNKF